ncbi:MAG TPA: serine/threonine-protein kinase, partial [Propionibacteriaceae bacterium]|nr:serine/threonine-protein kinase [Propionibacteriaceae bacterium]
MQRLRPGYVLSGRYRLVRHVASGGMGQVWEALDETLERRVALKIMHPNNADEVALAERFRDEARFAAQLSHPNIVTVHDYLEDDGLAYLVMEFVDGPTVASMLSRGPLDPEEVRVLIEQLASALTVAHAAGIIHRDIKPANVLVTNGHAQLMDFGIARSIEGESRTLTGEVLGTAHYLSPEQALGRTVGPATDMYSLGVLAHEMLTASKPFDRGTPIATALAHVQDPPPPLPEGTPKDLATVITACLSKEPEDRPTAALVAHMLMLADTSPEPEPVDPDATMAQPVIPRRARLDSGPAPRMASTRRARTRPGRPSGTVRELGTGAARAAERVHAVRGEPEGDERDERLPPWQGNHVVQGTVEPARRGRVVRHAGDHDADADRDE